MLTSHAFVCIFTHLRRLLAAHITEWHHVDALYRRCGFTDPAISRMTCTVWYKG